MSQQADALMEVFGMTRATCKTCIYSIGRAMNDGGVLWCEAYQCVADMPCDAYEREPGSDDE